jgi:hypothetical protein
MTDYALKFIDEAEATSILYHKEGVIEASEGIEANAGHDVANYQNIDVLGTLYTDDVANYQNIDVLGTLYTNDVALEGWHVNVRDEGECLELAQYIVFPKNPRRVWA